MTQFLSAKITNNTCVKTRFSFRKETCLSLMFIDGVFCVKRVPVYDFDTTKNYALSISVINSSFDLL